MNGNAGANADRDEALQAAIEKFSKANPRSAAQYEAACNSLPGGNTRTVLYYPPYPLTIVQAEGIWLQDLDGHRYRDFLGEYTAGLYGHSHPELAAALHAAIDKGMNFGGHSQAEAEYADLLVARFPAVERIRFTNTGTEANLMAIALASAVRKSKKVMVMEGGYHGGVFYFAHGPSPVNAPYDYVYGRYNDLDHCLDCLRENGEDLAAVILEPMQGAGGCIPASPEFLEGLREETAKQGIILIFDEVMTSRLGPGGLHGLLNIKPDLVSFGKYLGGGASFGAFGGRADLMDRFDPRRPDALPHAGTFNNNVLTMNAGLKGMRDIFTEEACLELNRRGDELRARLNRAAEDLDIGLRFSGLGSLMTSQFQKVLPENIGQIDESRGDLRTLMHLDLMEAGFFIAPRGMINLSLPMSDQDLEAFFEAVQNFMQSRLSLLKSD